MSVYPAAKIEVDGADYSISVNNKKTVGLQAGQAFAENDNLSLDWQARSLYGSWLLDGNEIATKADIAAIPPPPPITELANAIIVKDEDELKDALKRGGTIIISGVITLSKAITFTHNSTTLYGFSTETSQLVLSNSATDNHVIFVDKQRLTLNNITIKGAATANRQTGILIGRNSDGLSIKHCRIETVGIGIYMPGGPTAPIVRDVTIHRNIIRDFDYGIYCSWNFQNWDVSHNNIVGDGCLYLPNKVSKSNAIWLGLGAHQLRVESNYCGNVQRMGIEIFWPFSNTQNTPAAASINQIDPVVSVCNNIVFNTGSMGISFGGARNSVVNNNIISNVAGIGLELVGDEGDSINNLPDHDINMTVVGNSIKNVHAGMRSAGTVLKPNTVTINNPITLTAPSSSVNTCTTGVKQFNLVTSDTAYATANQPVRIHIGNDLQKYMDGVIQSYTNSVLTVNVVSLGPNVVAGSSFSNWVIRYTGVRELTLNGTDMAWGCNELPVSDWSRAATRLKIESIATPDNVIHATVERYLGGNTVTIKPLGPEYVMGTGTFSDFRATTNSTLLGVSVDKINGLLFSNNTIDTVVDGNFSGKFGLQVFVSRNVIIDHNLFTKAGTRYILNNQSKDVIVRDNVLLASQTENVRLSGGPTAESLTQFGEEVNTKYSSLEGFYNFGSPNSVFKGNIIKNTPRNWLQSRTNGGSVHSEPFAQPHYAFNSMPFRGNYIGDINSNTVKDNYPALDYTQTWDGNTSKLFTGYSFNINSALSASRPDSQVVAFKINNSPVLFVNRIGETVITQPFINGTIKTGSYGIRLGAVATDKLGFFGSTPVVKPTSITNATSANIVAQFNNLLANLKLLGLN